MRSLLRMPTTSTPATANPAWKVGSLPFRFASSFTPQSSVRLRKLPCRKEGHADLSDRLADCGTRPAQDHYHGRATFYEGLEMPELALTTAIILAGLSSGPSACIALA